MSGLLQLDRVEYECSCQEWLSLTRLIFCRHCSILRCSSCTANDIDCTFCANCLENVPIGEARLRKNRCINCHECPICTAPLTANTSSDAVFLSCSTCRWSTYESDIKEQPTASNWKTHENAHEKELASIMEQMRGYELNEKAQRDIIKRRSNVVGSRMSDKFGLQQMYQRRLQAMEKPSWLVPEITPVQDIPELPDEAYAEPVDLSKIHSLEARLRQPAAGERELRPVRMTLKGRRFIRCLQCDRNLSKLEYSPSSIVFKIQFFARTYVPEVRLSREPQLVVGSLSSVFLTFSNESIAKADIVVMADNEEGSVECETAVIEFSLPPHDDTADIQQTPPSQSTIGDDVIVFRKLHRIGVRMDVRVKESQEKNRLSLVLKWRNELTAMGEDKGMEWRQTRVRVQLGKS